MVNPRNMVVNSSDLVMSLGDGVANLTSLAVWAAESRVTGRQGSLFGGCVKKDSYGKFPPLQPTIPRQLLPPCSEHLGLACPAGWHCPGYLFPQVRQGRLNMPPLQEHNYCHIWEELFFFPGGLGSGRVGGADGLVGRSPPRGAGGRRGRLAR